MDERKIIKGLPEQLELSGRVFDEQEFELASYIFNRFKNVNSNTVFQHRGSILGIGDPSKHLFCYYTINNGELLLKFKNCTPISPIDKKSINELIDKTIILFSNVDLTTKKPVAKNINKVEEQPAETYTADTYNDLADMKLLSFFTDAEKAVLQTENYLNINVTTYASVRLKNCLMRATKSNLGDILCMTKGQLFKIRNFGRKCFEELLDIIKAVANGAEQKPKNESYYKGVVELLSSDGNFYSYNQLISKLLNYDDELKKCSYKKETYPAESLGWYLCYINESLQNGNRALLGLSKDKVYSEYSSHKKEYPELYKELSDILGEFISECLTERESKIFALRLGINCKETSLQIIADNVGISRERVRQIAKRAQKKLDRKLKKAPIQTYCEVLTLKDRITSIGLGGFVFALIKFKRSNLAKFIMSSFYNDTALNGIHIVKQCF